MVHDDSFRSVIDFDLISTNDVLKVIFVQSVSADASCAKT